MCANNRNLTARRVSLETFDDDDDDDDEYEYDGDDDVFGGETHEHRRSTWICGDRARGRYDDGYGTRWMMMMDDG